MERRKIKANFFYLSIVGFITGVAFRSFFNLGLYFELFVLFIALVLFLWWLFSGKDFKKIYIVLISVFLLSSSVGLFRFSLYDLDKGDADLDRYVGTTIELAGFVSEEPVEKEKYTKIVVEISDEVKINVLTEKFPVLKYGNVISLSGKLEKPKNFQGDDGKTFDYVSYLSKDKIFYQMFFPEIKLISEDGGSFIKRGLFELKRNFLKSLGERLPEPHSALMGGLTVGAQESMGDELVEDFRKTGIIHIVVLSGYNITIVADAISKIFSFLPNFASSSLGLISIVFFALMTGASATIVRASIMAGLVLLSRVSRRKYNVSRALFLAAALMVFHNPKILIYDASFQLSFVATIGLLYVSPLIIDFFKFVTEKWNLRELTVSAIATQLFVLPLLLFKMGMLSLVSLPVNILILPIIPTTMLFGFLSGVVGFMSNIFASPFSWISYFLLEYELKVVDIFSSLSFSSINIENFSAWMMIFIYLLYGIGLYVLYKKRREKISTEIR